MTANSLQSLFQAIAQVRDENELQQDVMVKVGRMFRKLDVSSRAEMVTKLSIYIADCK